MAKDSQDQVTFQITLSALAEARGRMGKATGRRSTCPFPMDWTAKDVCWDSRIILVAKKPGSQSIWNCLELTKDTRILLLPHASALWGMWLIENEAVTMTSALSQLNVSRQKDRLGQSASHYMITMTTFTWLCSTPASCACHRARMDRDQGPAHISPLMPLSTQSL